MPIVFLVGLAAPFPVQAERPVVTVGVLAYMGAEQSLPIWKPTIDALSAALPDYAVRVTPLDLPGTWRAVENGEVDFLITNPGNYVELEAAFGISRIAMYDTITRVGSVLVTRRDRHDINTFEDMRGKRLAAVAPGAFGGFQVAWRELVAAGIDPFNDLQVVFTGFPMDRGLEAMLAGDADIAVMKACLLEYLAARGRIDEAEFKVIAGRSLPDYPCALSSPLYPDWPFAKLRATRRHLAKKVATALLAFEPPAGQLGWTVPLDYQPVHELFRELKIGPYEHLGRRTARELLRDHWHWLVALASAMVWWVIHVWRVEHLVRERTAALTKANLALEGEMAERQLAEERERHHRQELEHVARLSILGEMAGNLAHELNQPLAAITNYADGLANRIRRGRTDPEQFEEAAHRIAEQARRAALVIQRIRAFIRKRSGARGQLDINPVVREATELFKGPAGRKKVRIVLDLASSLPLVEIDPIQIQQVLLNLLQNALEAMEGGRVRQPRITLATMAVAGGVAVRVSDCGPGLTPEETDKLFQPYFTTKSDGIGLGLAISRSIIETHGGHISAEASDCGGAALTFWLPHCPYADPGGAAQGSSTGDDGQMPK